MQVRGVDLAVSESGSGRPFLWGHGLLGSVAQEDCAALLDWEEIALSARLVRYDARGHGRSEATLDPGDYEWDELGLDLWGLADARQAEAPVLGGLSMGCAATLHAAAAQPGRASGLVLMAPPTAWKTRPRQARVYNALASLIERWGLGAFRWASSLSRLLPVPPYAARLQRSMIDSLQHADARAVANALRGAAFSDLPAPEKLAAVDAPVLILAWRRDPAHPVSTAEALARIFPRAQLKVAGSLEEARAWSGDICEFLAGLTPRPASDSPLRG